MSSNIKFYKDALHSAAKQIEELRKQLAASQLREQQLLKRIASTKVLLEAVCAVNPDSACAKYELRENLKTINSTSDTIALEAVIAKAGDVMQERCSKVADWQAEGWTAAIEIRSLPSITLKDLK